MTLVIPGHAEAVARENEVRDTAFLAIEERINGIEALPLTLSHMVALDKLGSPFLWDRKAVMELLNPVDNAADVAIFLWSVSPKFRVLRTWKDWLVHFLFVRSIRKLKFGETCNAIFDYVEEAFQDAPGGTGKKSIPFASRAAHLVDNMAAEYHWSENDILNTPLKRLFQYRRCIQWRIDSKVLFFNKSDTIRGDFLRQLNAKN